MWFHFYVNVNHQCGHSEDIWGVKKYHLRREQKAQGRKVCSLFCCWAIYESIPTAFVKLGVNQVLGIGWCIKSILHTASIQCLGIFFDIIVDAARQITTLTIWLGFCLWCWNVCWVLLNTWVFWSKDQLNLLNLGTGAIWEWIDFLFVCTSLSSVLRSG